MEENAMSETISRRSFLKAASLTAVAALVQACAQPTATPKPAEPTKPAAAAQPTAKPAEPTKPAAAPAAFGESPALAELVKAGKLPTVDKRLPSDPLVEQPVQEIGQYGGTWRRAAIGPSDSWIINSRLSYSAFVRYTIMANEIIPHFCSKWEQNPAASEFTIYLRKGVKWSDGQPYNADDIMYWYNDVLNNKELTASIAAWLRVKDTAVVIEKVDDYTVKWKFADSYGLFIPQLASAVGQGIPDGACAHFMKQYHAKYAKKEDLDKKQAELKLENWWSLYNNRNDWTNVERPHIWPWTIAKAPPDNPVVGERNPYYWVVDTKGNQLPYIDRIRLDNVEKTDVVNLKAISGEIDAQWRHLTWQNYPLFVENAKKGDYRVLKHTSASGSDFLLIPNMNCSDKRIAELMQSKDFRHALSLGIDRKQINEVVYQGMGTPRQASVVPSVKYWKQAHSDAYASYDPKQANAILDKMGLDKKDAEGMRLGKDGQPLSIVIEVANNLIADTPQLVSQQLKAIGIRLTVNIMERNLYSTRGAAKTERQMGAWGQDRSAHALVEPLYWMPTWESQTTCGALYWDWYNTKGKEGVEPPDPVKKVYELYDKCKTAKTDEELTKYSGEIMDINAEEVWFIGTVGLLPAVAVVKNNVRNVPEQAVADWLCLHPGNCMVETWYFKS
jgi:peptide/nickel transport system substrate-binding protein